MKHLWLVLLFVAGNASAMYAFWTSAAFSNDPADCGTNYGTANEACADSALAAKLAEFPYWTYRLDGVGAPHALGVYGGYLWAIICDHCTGTGAYTADFTDDTPTADTFDSDDGEGGTGPYRQFGTQLDAAPTTGASRGAAPFLYRYKVQGANTLPNLPMMRMLRHAGDLTEGTLMLTMASGNGKSHESVAWFKECAETAAGGGPAPAARDACCDNIAGADMFDPPAVGENAQPPGTNFDAGSDYSYHDNAAGYGGKGNFADCTSAGLTHIGPIGTGNLGDTWAWSTFHWEPSGIAVTKLNSYGYEEREWRWYAVGYGDTGSWSNLMDQEHCVQATAIDENRYTTWEAPTGGYRTHFHCWGNQVHPTSGLPIASGDSGAAVFAYIESYPAGERWVYVGAGRNSIISVFMIPHWTHEVNKWIYGIERRSGDAAP